MLCTCVHVWLHVCHQVILEPPGGGGGHVGQTDGVGGGGGVGTVLGKGAFGKVVHGLYKVGQDVLGAGCAGGRM